MLLVPMSGLTSLVKHMATNLLTLTLTLLRKLILLFFGVEVILNQASHGPTYFSSLLFAFSLWFDVFFAIIYVYYYYFMLCLKYHM
jgi:hypothetical protein